MNNFGGDTQQKALAINLDPLPYGVFAEIGAGQEVARWFFHVGGAAGTVAKTISAYDMTVSNALYGTTSRYVSRRRLQAMLEHEFVLVHRIERNIEIDASLLLADHAIRFIHSFVTPRATDSACHIR